MLFLGILKSEKGTAGSDWWTIYGFDKVPGRPSSGYSVEEDDPFSLQHNLHDIDEDFKSAGEDINVLLFNDREADHTYLDPMRYSRKLKIPFDYVKGGYEGTMYAFEEHVYAKDSSS